MKNQHSRGSVLTHSPRAQLGRYLENATACALDGERAAAQGDRGQWTAMKVQLRSLRQAAQQLPSNEGGTPRD